MEYTLMKHTRSLAISAALAAAMFTSQLAVTEFGRCWHRLEAGEFRGIRPSHIE